MLALRNAVRNDRWEEAWQQSSAQIRQIGRVHRAVQPKRMPTVEGATPTPPATIPPVETLVEPVAPAKPTPIHPWRRTNYATKARLAEAKANART
jgi:hypothetical protein